MIIAFGAFHWNVFPDNFKMTSNVNTIKHKNELVDIITEKRTQYLSILWVNYHHSHLILIMKL